jgi:hypothetical protein
VKHLGCRIAAKAQHTTTRGPTGPKIMPRAFFSRRSTDHGAWNLKAPPHYSLLWPSVIHGPNPKLCAISGSWHRVLECSAYQPSPSCCSACFAPHGVPYPTRKRASPGQHHIILGFVRHPAHSFPFLFGHFSNGQCQCRCSAAADAVWSAPVWGSSVVAHQWCWTYAAGLRACSWLCFAPEAHCSSW